MARDEDLSTRRSTERLPDTTEPATPPEPVTRPEDEHGPIDEQPGHDHADPGNDHGGPGDERGTHDRTGQDRLAHTRTAGTWAAVVVATVALIVLLVFILQNLQLTTVTFLGLRGELPVGVALLLAAAIGGLLVALVGAARILQLRRTAHRGRRGAKAVTGRRG